MFPYDDSTAETKLNQRVNFSLRQGGFVGLSLTIPLATLLGGLCLSGRRPDLWYSWSMVSLGVVQSAMVYQLGRRGRATGRNAIYLLLPVILLPMLLALATHFLQPGGTARLLHSPFVFATLIAIVLTGFSLDPRLSVIAGLYCAAGHFALFLLARPQLELLQSAEAGLGRMLSDPIMYAIKTFMLAVTGGVVALLSVAARRLILRVSREEQEKGFIRDTFGMIVDPCVRDRMIQGKIELGGEVRVTTALFCDMRGFSGFSERMPPKELLLVMKEYFDLMSAQIRRYQGTILEYVGDEVMALFGAPLALKDHAERALRAACGMREALAAQRPVWEREGKPAVRAGVGLHTGSMLVGNIGSSQRYKYGALGDSVNLASRLQGLTKDYGVAVIASEETVRAVEGRFRVRELDRVRVRGREAEVRVYEVLGPEEGSGAMTPDA